MRYILIVLFIILIITLNAQAPMYKSYLLDAQQTLEDSDDGSNIALILFVLCWIVFGILWFYKKDSNK